MAGSTSVTVSQINIGQSATPVYVKKVQLAFTADASNGSVPDTTIELNGWCIKVTTNPGSTAPTANYDITLKDSEDAGLDAFMNLLKDRHTTNGETVYTTPTGSSVPLLLAGNYDLSIANNSVNSATGTVTLYIVEKI